VDDVTAKGTVNAQGATLSEIDGGLYHGSLKGAARLGWADGWSLQGTFSLAGLDLGALMPVITRDIVMKGRLDAKGSYTMQTRNPGDLLAAPQVTASFHVADGTLGNVDLMRLIQSSPGGRVTGGQTRFTEFKGTLAVAEGRYQFRQLRLSSGPLSAEGSADIGPNGRVTGEASASFRARTAQAHARFAVTGGLGSLELRRR
jgi:hypothetical protein